MVEQNRADTAPLMLVEHGEGDFGARRSGGDIAGDADEAFVPPVRSVATSATWLAKSISVKRTKSWSLSECLIPKKR